MKPMAARFTFHPLAKSFPPFVYHDAYSCPWPSSHRFPMNKFLNLKQYLVRENIFDGSFTLPPHPLEVDELMAHVIAVHDKEYVDRFIHGKLSKEEKRMIGLEFSDHLVYRTFAEVGGTIHTLDLALKTGLAVNLAGGTHHAHKCHGAGFTIINDMAVAAKRAISLHKLRSVLIFDCDVHQGDGTATIFQNDPSVYTVSIHCVDNYPFVKQNSNLDVDLASGTGDVEYLDNLKQAYDLAVKACRPDAVIYDAGVDVAKSDKLGRLDLSDQAIYDRDYFVLDECMSRGIPVCAVIGGGYDPDPLVLAARHALLHRAAIAVWSVHRR